MPTEHYGTVAGVVEYSGVRQEDLRVDDLDATLTGWLVEASDLIDAEAKRRFRSELDAATIDELPPVVHSVARSIVVNMVGYAVQRRKAPVVRIDDWSVRAVKEDVFPEDLRRLVRALRPPRAAIGSARMVTPNLRFDVDDDG